MRTATISPTIAISRSPNPCLVQCIISAIISQFYIYLLVTKERIRLTCHLYIWHRFFSRPFGLQPPRIIHRTCLSFRNRGKRSRRQRRNNPHSFCFFFPSFCYVLSSHFFSLLLTQSLSLAPIASPKPNVTTLSLSSQPARVQHSGVTYTRLAYRISLPTGSHH